MSNIDTNKVFNRAKTMDEYQNTPIFCGADVGLIDSINKPFPKLFSLYKELKSLDWSEDEFDYEKQCPIDFKSCHTDVKAMMIETLAWQWEADSVASNTPYDILSPFISSTEFAICIKRIMDNECLVPNTEVYVKGRGWVTITDVKKGDIVLSFDNGNLLFEEVSHKIDKSYKGDIYHFNGANFSQMTTPKHRMVTYRKFGSNIGYEIHEAEKCPTNGSMAFCISGFKEGSLNELTIKECFWIAFQADGSYRDERYNGKRTGCILVTFGFKKERKIERFTNILNEIGYEYSRYVCNNGITNFDVKIPKDEFIINGKSFEWVDLTDKSSQWCSQFINELSHWDGCIRRGKNGVKNAICTYTTTNKRCIDIVSTISHLCGYSCKLYKMKEVVNQKECYQLSITERLYFAGNSVNVDIIPYDGTVHCITVPSGAFLMRHNGIISVTGNCLHGLTYSEIVRMSFDNPREVMDDILNFQHTNQRMELVEHTLGEAYDLSCKYRSGLIEMSDDLYRDVCLKTIICMLVLERIQFMASFAITFTICSTGLFQAIGKAVQKICQDELEIHCQFDKQVLLYEMETEKGRKAITELKDWIVSIIRDAIDSEFAFVDSLFRDGRSLTGTNPELVKQWVLFNTRDVVNFFGLKDEFTDIKFPSKNPMPILDNWIDIGKTQSAPQEQQIAQYKLNAVDFSKTDDVEFDLGDLEFQ